MSKDLSVFLVDDDQMYLMSLKNELSQRFKNIRLRTFLSGEDCIKHMNEKPDIIVIDYRLADDSTNAMNGVEVMKQIKSISKDNEVIIISGQDKLDVVINAIKNGAAEYIPKTENTYQRLHSVLKNSISNLKLFRTNRQYMIGNLVVATMLLIFLTIMIWYYLIH